MVSAKVSNSQNSGETALAAQHCCQRDVSGASVFSSNANRLKGVSGEVFLRWRTGRAVCPRDATL